MCNLAIRQHKDAMEPIFTQLNCEQFEQQIVPVEELVAILGILVLGSLAHVKLTEYWVTLYTTSGSSTSQHCRKKSLNFSWHSTMKGLRHLRWDASSPKPVEEV
ncbi:hypothetical protein E2C01_033094 [Portunus trituberculatus]|uniref:PiggyBac transposable element-derived protein domain-containing protein n=1 Tax=Portunus trituberculatus TaxID=210409 RepID=A0A5B7F1I5_PORTR|nr:hypothetical protein [Portunus trituberculatus]